ncbi:TIM barrel protein [Microbacterium sp. cx-55]|uniref:TIM barrel protein n=1 Tax=Microbacterium sp. cx-55 TaxID=2875948 RepID=UPI001CBAB65D|nr:TIM barrel protein [Microbacterium sp. cx-55]MBZ4487764.1 TIM barrel protein [Microbacterium sp. cx-55]UGB34824.1 TIM barrel protein [Microbacterium sp. cx-55]
MEYSANIEMQFTEAGPLPARVRAAAEAGFDAVEFWRWEDTDVPALAAAARELDVQIALFATDWSIAVADPAERARFTASVDGAIRAAGLLGARQIVVSLGPDLGLPRESLVDELSAALRVVVPRAHDAGVTLLLEPVNTRVDHPGSALSSTADAREILARVDHPALRLLFDVYHSAAQGEDVAQELRRSRDLIDYVQLADSPGRHEPGTGEIDWMQVAAVVREIGYTGRIGLEFSPLADSATALEQARAVWEKAWAGSIR